jgi:hypothetical protein
MACPTTTTKHALDCLLGQREQRGGGVVGALSQVRERNTLQLAVDSKRQARALQKGGTIAQPTCIYVNRSARTAPCVCEPCSAARGTMQCNPLVLLASECASGRAAIR